MGADRTGNSSMSVEELNAALGYPTITPDGRARARRRLAEARARWTPELRAALRQLIGHPSSDAA
jgi:hypothetical protein